MRYEEIPTIIPTQKEFVSRDLVDQNMYMGYRSIEGTDWYLVSGICGAGSSGILRAEFPAASVFGFLSVFADHFLFYANHYDQQHYPKDFFRHRPDESSSRRYLKEAPGNKSQG